MAKISVLVIALNEEKNIRDCLGSVSWADEIIVVDSGSTDATKSIAAEFTDKVVQNRFRDFSSQKNFALSLASGEWVFFLDADERVSTGLKKKILSVVAGGGDNSAYLIKRDTFIFGRLMKNGGHDRDYQMRFFLRAGAEFFQPVHEKLVPGEGNIGRIEEPLIHYSTPDLTDYLTKMNLYTGLEAEFKVEKGLPVGFLELTFKPVLRFVQRYFFQLGFRDGYEGFLYYLLSAFYDFVKYAKCIELRNKEKPDAS